MREPHLVRFRPVERGCLEGALGERVGHLALEALEARELLAPAVAHRFAQLAVEIAEELERLAAAPLLAHEDERRRPREQVNRAQRFQPALVRQDDEALAERAVADLVMVLQEVDEASGRQLARLL